MNSAILSVLSATAGAGQAPWWINLPYIVVPLVVMWLVFLRPQMKRQRELQEKIGGIKKGDQVLTAGGFLGKVIKVDEVYAEVELAPNVRVKTLKSTISDIVPPAGTKPAND